MENIYKMIGEIHTDVQDIKGDMKSVIEQQEQTKKDLQDIRKRLDIMCAERGITEIPPYETVGEKLKKMLEKYI